MRVLITSRALVSDGQGATYVYGSTPDLDEDLARDWIAAGYAERIGKPEPEPEPEPPAEPPATEPAPHPEPEERAKPDTKRKATRRAPRNASK